MTYEEAKELLKSLEHKKKLCRAKQRQISEEKAQISIAAVDYSRERVQGGSEGNSAQQRYAERMEKLSADFDKLLDETFAIEDMLVSRLGELSEIEQTIMIERYMHGKSWRQIERDYEYSIDGVYKINSRAIKKISKR